MIQETTQEPEPVEGTVHQDVGREPQITDDFHHDTEFLPGLGSADV